MSDRPPFNKRGFTSFVILLTFLVVALSGLMLYLSPKGRVAHWTGWTLLGLSKTQWEDLHLTMTIALFLGVVFHLYFNWSYLLRYMRDMAEGGLSSKRELGFATVLVGLIFFGTHFAVPPFSTVSALGEDIKDYWEDAAPTLPYAHAEESTIAEFAANMDLPLDQVTRRLHEKGFAFDSSDVVIADLADHYGKTPNALFQEVLNRQTEGTDIGAGRGSGMGMGSGMGRRTLKDICEREGIALQEALTVLQDRGIEAKGDDTLRSIGEKNGHTPSEVMSWLGAR